MKRDLRAEIRALLLTKPEGLTVTDIVVATKATDKSVRVSLKSMPDVYIDRWEFQRQGPLAAVFCAVEVPEDCPRPSRLKRTPEEKAAYHRNMTANWHKARKERQLAAPKPEPTSKPEPASKPQGLTTIRGPWPT